VVAACEGRRGNLGKGIGGRPRGEDLRSAIPLKQIVGRKRIVKCLTKEESGF